MKKNLQSDCEEVTIIRCGPPFGEQIGDHKGFKRTRNRHIRRAWRNGGRILADDKYRGYD